MRKMKNKHGEVFNIVEHWITRNFWEYYITDENFSDDIVRAVVWGHEIEVGDISKDEIRPYVITKTKRLGDLMPLPDWKWED